VERAAIATFAASALLSVCYMSKVPIRDPQFPRVLAADVLITFTQLKHLASDVAA